MKGIAFYGLDFFKRKTGNDLIKENITRILLTNRGERVNKPLFGSNLRGYLFENSNVLQEDVEEDIRQSIINWEPRVSIQSLVVQMRGPNSAYIYLDLKNKETMQDFTYEVVLRL
jgi:phage baseplate assembly protein W